MLLQIYLLYEKSPKKLSQLSNLHLELHQKDVELDRLNAKNDREVTAIDDIISARLDNECNILKPVARVLSSETWTQTTQTRKIGSLLITK